MSSASAIGTLFALIRLADLGSLEKLAKTRNEDVMKIKNIKVIRGLFLFAGSLVVLPLMVDARTLKLSCGGQKTITAAVERLKPGDILLVEGHVSKTR